MLAPPSNIALVTSGKNPKNVADIIVALIPINFVFFIFNRAGFVGP